METYIKLYDWIANIKEFSTSQKIVYALIYQMSQVSNAGWYGGVQKMANRLCITKRSCTTIINDLVTIGAIEKMKAGRRNALIAIPSWAEEQQTAYETRKQPRKSTAQQ